MPLVRQSYEFFRKAMKDGKADMHTGHPYIAEEEEQKRQDNAPDADGKEKTKIAWDAADPDSYREWHKERAKWMKDASQNPTLATDAMIVALRAYSPEGRAAIIEQIGAARAMLEAQKAAKAGIPKAQIPAGEKRA